MVGKSKVPSISIFSSRWVNKLLQGWNYTSPTHLIFSCSKMCWTNQPGGNTDGETAEFTAQLKDQSKTGDTEMETAELIAQLKDQSKTGDTDMETAELTAKLKDQSKTGDTDMDTAELTAQL